MDILQKIITNKKKEIEERKSLYPVKLLEKSIYFNSPSVSFRKYLLRKDLNGIIAEIKRRSPSRGIINQYVSIERTSIGYMQAGASALSVLTDKEFFGGKNEDLSVARKFNFCPILRKDFIVDEYQVIESKSIGADVILLLANVLKANQVKELARLAKSLNMEVLLEVRNEEELFTSLNEFIDVVGVNNRNLKDFNVDIQTSFALAPLIPPGIVKISESGISKTETIIELKSAGYNGFLIGEVFMQHARPEIACAAFIKEIIAMENHPVKQSE